MMITEQGMRATLRKPSVSLHRPEGLGHITERIWLRAFGTPPEFRAPLGTSDTLRHYLLIAGLLII